MQSIRAAVALVMTAMLGQISGSPVKQIDHVMFNGGTEVSGLVTVLREKFELPVVFDGLAQTPPSGGTCFSFGNICLEVVPLPPTPDNVPRRPQLGSLALQAVEFATTVSSLKALEIDHFPATKQASWTTIGVRGLGGVFFIEYQEGMSGRRERFRRELDARGGGPLGIVRMIEVSQVRTGFQDVRPKWIRLFGEPITNAGDIWMAGEGPAIRVVTPDDGAANRVVVQIRSRSTAAAALRRFAIPFTESDSELRIDPAALIGLKIVLREA
jgi:hypothetical protein